MIQSTHTETRACSSALPVLGMALSLKNYQNVSNTFHFPSSILGAILERMKFIGKAKG